MTLLVVASPCALVLSIPSAILVAIAAGARQGILFRGGVAVESLAGVNHFAFDKTGTLTTGQLQVARIETSGQISTEEVLDIAAAVAQIFDPSPFPRCRGGGETPRSDAERNGRRGQHPRFRHGSDDRPPVGRRWQPATDGAARLRRLARSPRTAPRPRSGWQAKLCSASSTCAIDSALATPAVIAALQKDGNSVALISGDRAEAAADGGARSGHRGSARRRSRLTKSWSGFIAGVRPEKRSRWWATESTTLPA